MASMVVTCWIVAFLHSDSCHVVTLLRKISLNVIQISTFPSIMSDCDEYFGAGNGNNMERG